MLNVPNAITLARIALVPVMAYFLFNEAYEIALPLFAVVALTDFADGYIARRLKLASAFGARLDPIADKLSMFVATVLLAWHALLPLWLAVAIVARDIVIVLGVIAYRAAVGQVTMAPTRLSKLNTVLEFMLLLLVMAIGAAWLAGGAWMSAAFVIVFTTVVGSGVQYVWLWGRKAFDEGGHARRAAAPRRPPTRN